MVMYDSDFIPVAHFLLDKYGVTTHLVSPNQKDI